ncbi:ComEC/Rec2 family competence protein [Mucilaginibacter sp. UR6-11]|uniref:ComEC/Rec2 family competence protein n=1 Tax=Mucilaginibacter sp. UR6-11 TaxID=1435644 RepID=UPI001E43158B|nr:ComEC/Rec2 family competence protein [Mucilaginibacter sp. UR6-11]MCC8426221.1 ComEC family competence protein [Mucilaginibacter sp. UR6-11]
MIANHKGEIPFVVLIIPFLLGTTLGLSFAFAALLFWIAGPLVLSGAAFIVLNLTYARFGLYKARWIGGSLITLFLFLCGWLSVIRGTELNNDTHFSRKPAQYLVVKINNEPAVKNGLVRFTANVEQQITNRKSIPTSGTLLITVKDTTANKLYYGDELLIPAKYNAADPPFNPAEFNYKQYLANQNICRQAFLYPGQYVVRAHGKGNPVIAFSLRLRQRLVEKLKTNMHDTSALAVASTLILGYKADLSNELLQAYSKTGTIHILSVSGGHVAIIYLLLNIVFGFLGRYQNGKPVKAILIITLIWYYSLLTGFSPAVCRAALMISLVIIGKTYSRYINTLNILAVSAFMLLLYNPYLIADVGFQLSYLAVAGLIIFQPLVYKWLTFKNKWADKLWAAGTVSIAAQVVTFPLSAFYFHQFPVYFLLSNLIITLPVLVIMYAGLACLLVPQLPYLSAGLGYILEKSILLMNKALVLIEYSPFAGIGKIWFTTFEYLLAYVIIICLFYFLSDRKKWLLMAGLTTMLILGTSISLKRINALRQTGIVFLNLKKHPGLIFKHGDKAVIIADINHTDKIYQYSIQPYLDSSKVADTMICGLAKNIRSTFLVKSDNLIQFENKKILLFNQQLQHRRLPEKLNIDYLYITGNPQTSVGQLNENYNYAMLIIDGSNADRSVSEWEKQAKYLNVNYRVLKRNKSLVVLSN